MKALSALALLFLFGTALAVDTPELDTDFETVVNESTEDIQAEESFMDSEVDDLGNIPEDELSPEAEEVELQEGESEETEEAEAASPLAAAKPTTLEEETYRNNYAARSCKVKGKGFGFKKKETVDARKNCGNQAKGVIFGLGQMGSYILRAAGGSWTSGKGHTFLLRVKVCEQGQKCIIHQLGRGGWHASKDVWKKAGQGARLHIRTHNPADVSVWVPARACDRNKGALDIGLYKWTAGRKVCHYWCRSPSRMLGGWSDDHKRRLCVPKQCAKNVETRDKQKRCICVKGYIHDENGRCVPARIKCPSRYKKVGNKCIRSSFLRCPRGYIRKNGDCVRLAGCPSGFYRIGTKCKRLPSTVTCEAEVNALAKRKAEEDPLREKELAIIRTIRGLLGKLNGIKDIDTDSKVSVNDLLPLLQTASAEDRKFVEVNGKNGVFELLKKLEAKLMADLADAKNQILALRKHCTTICEKNLKIRRATVKTWADREAKLRKAIKALTDKMEHWKGKLAALEKDFADQQAEYRIAKRQRDKDLALLAWLRKKVEEVHNTKTAKATADIQLEAADFTSVVAGLDSSDASLTGVITEMQRAHPELDAIRKLLDDLEKKIKKEDAADQLRLHKMALTIEKWKAYVNRLKTKVAAYGRVLVRVKAQLAAARKALGKLELNCAKFGDLSIL